MPINYTVNLKQYDVVISGRGPAALASAWEAAKQGKSVLLISNRARAFYRVQTLYLTPETRQYLLNMLHTKPLNNARDNPQNLSEEKHASPKKSSTGLTDYSREIRELAGVSIKDLERFLASRINELHTPVDTILNAEIEHVDTSKNLVRIKSLNSEEIHVIGFSYLLCADGAKHHAVNRVNESLPTNEQIQYSKGPTPLSKHHFSAYLSIRRFDNKPLDLLSGDPMHAKKIFDITDPDNAKILKAHQGSLITFFINRFSFEKHQGKLVKIGISGEVPASIAPLKEWGEKQEELLLYLRKIITKEFFSHIHPDLLDIGITPPSKKYGIKKDKLKLSFFETSGGKANQIIKVHHDSRMIIIGDSYMQSNYQTGSGVNNALYEAKAFGQLITIEKSAEDEVLFINSINNELKHTHTKTSLINLAASVPYVGKPLIEKLSSSNKKQMRKWLNSTEVNLHKMADPCSRNNVYPTYLAPHNIQIFSNAYDDVTRTSGTFYEIKKAIELAEHFIFISMWNISLTVDLGMKQTLGELLIAAEQRGIAIFIIGWDSKAKPINKKNRIENIDYLKEFDPTGIFYKRCTPGKTTLDHLFLSHHQKFIMTDKVGFVCGMNMVGKSVDSIEHSDIGGKMWHDTAISIEGIMIEDMFKEFITTWQAQGDKMMLLNSDVDAIKLLEDFKKNISFIREAPEHKHQQREIQLLTSNYNNPCPTNIKLFSNPNQPESSNEIHQAMIKTVQEAENYLFITTQYFIGYYENHEQSANRLTLALIKRIQSAYQKQEDFHVYFTITAVPGAKTAASIVDSIARKQWKTIRFLINELNKKTNGSTEKYITFIELGKLDKANSHYHQVYVHAKYLFTPNSMIMGSANLNERSLAINRDNELCVRIQNYCEDIQKFRDKIVIEYFGTETFEQLLKEDVLNHLGSDIARKIIEDYLSKQLALLPADHVFTPNDDLRQNSYPEEFSNRIDGCALPWGLLEKRNLLLAEKPSRIPDTTPTLVSILNQFGGNRYSR